MALYEFGPNDIFYNQLEAHPDVEFFIYDGKIYYQNKSQISGAFTDSELHVPTGHVSLYELNVDRRFDKHTFDPDIDADGDGFSEGAGVKAKIFPFITKQGTRGGFKTVSTTVFDSQFNYGDIMTGSYPMSASIKRKYYAENSSRKHITSLKNTLNHYRTLSPHFEFASSGRWDRASQSLNLISIPSIFYGSSIKKGSVNLKYYITGTLVGHLHDINRNGELIQVAPTGSTGSGSVAGVVLYNEGFLLLTGAAPIFSLEAADVSRDYINDLSSLQSSSWLWFGMGANDGTSQTATLASASFGLDFQGTTYVPTVTLLAHANRGELNWSNNPTYIVQEDTVDRERAFTSSYGVFESSEIKIKNTISSSYLSPTGSFKKQTFITKIGIYDDQKNLIGIASVAEPVKKTENRDFTFKLKMDF